MQDNACLLIDDERSVVESLELFLEDEGFSVHKAFSGSEGLDLFMDKRPDLVITDLKMPAMTGIELINEIRKIDKYVPIVIMTGYGTLGTAIDAFRLNVFDYVTKPVEIDELKSTLDRFHAARMEAKKVEREILRLHEKVEKLKFDLSMQHEKLLGADPLIQSGRMISRILHELNNPLTYIVGVSELLQMIHPDMDKIRAIHDQAIRMDRIISSMTKRLKDSRSKEQQPLQLNEILREEVSYLEMMPAFRNKVVVSWRFAQDLPEVMGCTSDFSQIIGNLLRNAVEAMENSPDKRLIISTAEDEYGIHLAVEDTGPGVEEHLREAIFEAFYTTKKGDAGDLGSLGIGIGLYHSRELLLTYGGRITCGNAESGGAVFTVTLPRSLIAPESHLNSIAQ